MNDKGFTLIELLAVIVILAIILAIAIPSISNIIDSTQLQAYVEDEQIVIKVTKTYVSINTSYLPVNIGDKREVSLSELQNDGYISEIRNPKDKSKICNGYVLITKLIDGDYNYTPYLNCQSNIGSSTEDGLIAHYTFDDYQESTENHIINGDVKTLQYWDVAQDSGAGDVLTKTLITDDGVTDTYSVEFNVVSKLSWGYSHHTLRTYIPAEWFDTMSMYTLSFWAKKISGVGSLAVYIHDGSSTNTVMSKKTITLTSEWERYEFSFTPLSSGNEPVVFITTDQGNIYRIDEMQLEKKPYATPFTDSIRLGVVKDYSLNNNQATLLLASTPTWISNASIGKGAYSFDGIDDAIDFGAVSENILRQGTEGNNFTLSAWTKTSDYQDADSRIVIARAGYHDGIQMNTNGSVSFNIFDENSSRRSVASKALDLNVYHYVVATFVNRIMYLYVDGQLVDTNDFFNTNPTVKFRIITSNFTSGATSDGSSHQYRGIIDDVRIYSRALNANEIKYNYDVIKYKIK